LDALSDESEPIVNESHFSICALKCRHCGAAWIEVFSELIDWDDGDDSQAWTFAPVTSSELDVLRRAGETRAESALHQLKLDRRYIRRVDPRGNSRELYWVDGAVWLLPHD
jgi:hypothetical protein